MITKSSFKKDMYDMSDLLSIMSILRAPGGCPWDIEQTHASIRNNIIEEAYEVVDAIDRSDDTALCEELGDILLQVAFHSQISKDGGGFDFSSVVDGICKKLILRHPHVFGDVSADNVDKVLDNWEAIKRVEKHQTSYTDTLCSVPMSFPALMRAAKVQKRAAKAGFDWDDVSGAFSKLPEETDELSRAVKTGNSADIAEEFGDLLFAAVNVSRFLKVDPEQALNAATDKFIKRFAAIEETVKKTGHDMKELSLSELDGIWNDVKHTVK